MVGLDVPFGISREATLRLHDSRKTTPFDKGMLRSILSGSIRLQHRLHQADLVDSPLCPFCGLQPETIEHCFWECPCWTHIRQRNEVPVQRVRDQWPACTRQCGIFVQLEDVFNAPTDLEIEEQTATARIDRWCLEFGGDASRPLESEEAGRPHGVEEVGPPAAGSGGGEGPPAAGPGGSGFGELLHDGRVVVFTDGACRNNASANLRRAGSGIFYAARHPRNFSCPVPGRSQTNQRAELLAIVLTLHRDGRDLEVRTDSKHCCDGALSWHLWSASGWRGGNKDLWARFDFAMRARRPGSVSFVKVKGHVTDADVASLRVSLADKVGNDGADEMACLGADSHAIDPAIASAARLQGCAAQRVQRMMVEILAARREREEAAGACPRQDDAEEPEHEMAELDGEPHALVLLQRVPRDAG